MSAPDYGAYFCCNCRLDAPSKEIIGLKESILSLSSELQNIKCSTKCSSSQDPFKLNHTNLPSAQHRPTGNVTNNSHPSFLSYSATVSSSDTIVRAMPPGRDSSNLTHPPSSSSLTKIESPMLSCTALLNVLLVLQGSKELLMI